MDSACGICFASRVEEGMAAEYIFWGRRWAAYITTMATSRVRVRDLLSTQRKLWVPSESVRMSREPIGRTVSPFDIQVAMPSPVWVGRSEWRQKEIFNLSRPCRSPALRPRGRRNDCRVSMELTWKLAEDACAWLSQNEPRSKREKLEVLVILEKVA